MQFNSIDETFNWLLSINDSDKPGALMVDGHAASLKELQDINFQAISFIKDCWKQDKTRELPDGQLMDMTKKIIKKHDEYIIVRLYEAGNHENLPAMQTNSHATNINATAAVIALYQQLKDESKRAGTYEAFKFIEDHINTKDI